MHSDTSNLVEKQASGLVMAEEKSEGSKRSSFINSMEGDFESSVKARMNWTRVQWEEEVEPKFRLKKLVNSLKFWSKKLAKAQTKTNVILTVFNTEKDVYMSLADILNAIWDIDKNIKFAGHATFRNPRYLSITFKTEEERNLVKDKLKFVADNNVAFLDWAGETNEHFIKVLWLSDTTDIRHSRNLLESYFDITEQNRETLTLLNGASMPSGTVNFKGRLKKDKLLNSVPHLAEVDGLECLLNISGRKCLCLSCEKLGHKARVCPTPYCSRCRSLCPKKHTCLLREDKISTYAEKVSGNSAKEENDHLKDFTSGAILTKINPVEDNLKLSVESKDRKGVSSEEHTVDVKHSKVLTSSQGDDGGSGASLEKELKEVKDGEGEFDREPIVIVANEVDNGEVKEDSEANLGFSVDAQDMGFGSEAELDDLVIDGEVILDIQSEFSESQNMKVPDSHDGAFSVDKETEVVKPLVEDVPMDLVSASLKRKNQVALHQGSRLGGWQSDAHTYGRKGKISASEKEKKKWNKLMEMGGGSS